MTVTPRTFGFVADLVRRRSGIALEPHKLYLVENRLLPLARAAGHSGVEAYVTALRHHPDERTHDSVVEALTTHETSWFRDVVPFQALREHVVPTWRADAPAGARLRVWSAACSTGQEPYSVVMATADLVPGVDVLATDLSEPVLERARRGRYTQLEVDRGLPAPMLARHLTRTGGGWQVSEDLRRRVTFRRHNLLDPAPAGPFDVVLLRNVLIYLDAEARRGVLERVHGVLRRGGWLVLGAAETTGVHGGFEPVALGGAHLYRAAAAVAPAVTGGAALR